MALLTTLIDVAGLAARLDDSETVLLDCRFDLARPQWGRESWLQGHIPGARFVDLDRDLSSPPGPATGRHPLPSPDDFAARASSWGIDERVQVVAYDQGNGMFAARAWWLFRWLGHRAVAVLDGGYAGWVAAGHPIDTAGQPGVTDAVAPERVPARGPASGQSPRRFVPRPDDAAVVDAVAVAAGLAPAASPSRLRLVDARAADRFAGQNETMDPVAGHVPGASNHPFARNLDPSGRMLPAAELRARWL